MHLIMSPLELMQRLAMLVAWPRVRLIRFHGVLAHNAKLRALVVACAGELKIVAASLGQPVIERILTHLCCDPQPPPRGRARQTAPGNRYQRAACHHAITRNTGLAVQGARAFETSMRYDDPDVEGATCYVSRVKTGGRLGGLGLAEDESEASIACRQVGPVKFAKPLRKLDEVFTERTSSVFQRLRVVRMVNADPVGLSRRWN